MQVFNKLDRNRNGSIEVDDIIGIYNAKQHPDVKSGKKTEEEILGDFLDTFEIHHSLAVIFIVFCSNFYMYFFYFLLLLLLDWIKLRKR